MDTQFHLETLQKKLKTRELYPEATQNIKFQETRSSFFVKTGATVYKFKKPDNEYSSVEVKEAFLNEELKLGHMYGDSLYLGVVPLTNGDADVQFGGKGKVLDYALKLRQVGDRYFMSWLVDRDKLNPVLVGRVARHLAAAHAKASLHGRDAEKGRGEHLLDICEDLLYQASKYLNVAVTQPMLDLVRRPLEKFFEENRKIFQKRIKKGRVVNVHGAFLPEHIYAKGQEIAFISAHDVQRNFCVMDAVADVAMLMVALEKRGMHDWAELFLKRYITASRDREITKLLPAYKTMKALRLGVDNCEQMVEAEPEEKTKLRQHASEFFNLAVQFSREIKKIE